MLAAARRLPQAAAAAARAVFVTGGAPAGAPRAAAWSVMRPRRSCLPMMMPVQRSAGGVASIQQRRLISSSVSAYGPAKVEAAVSTEDVAVLELRVPVPRGAHVENTLFHLPASATVQTLEERIKEESPDTVHSVQVMAGGQRQQQAGETTLASLQESALFVQVNGGEAVSVRPCAAVAKAVRGGAYTLGAVSHLAKCINVSRTLRDLDRSTVLVEEYYELCDRRGLNRAQAHELLKQLHATATVLYFEEDDELSSVVFTRPNEFIAGIYGSFGVPSPIHAVLDEKIEESEAREGKVLAKLAPFESLKAELDADAERTASMFTWGLTGATFAGAGLYWYLCYELFSWDIMEPVTFFTALGVSALGYTWWSWTNRDYEYENIYEYFATTSRAKRYARAHFNQDKYDELHALLEERQRETAQLKQERFFLDILSGTAPGLLTNKEESAAAAAEDAVEQEKEQKEQVEESATAEEAKQSTK